jgi:hypothetical protein
MITVKETPPFPSGQQCDTHAVDAEYALVVTSSNLPPNLKVLCIDQDS